MKLSKGQRGRWSLMAGILLFTLLLSACGSVNSNTTSSSTPAANSGPDGKGCKKIGVSFPETNTSYRWDNQDKPLLISALKNALSITDNDIIYNNANGSTATQQTQAESMLTRGACILVVAPSDSKVAAAIVDKAKAKHVPVVSYDRLINSKDVTAYVSFQGQDVGKLQGDYIAKHYQDYVKKNGTTNTVIINGSQTDNNAILFKEGLHTSLDPLFKNNTLKNVYEQFTDWTGPVAQKDMEAALSRTGNKVAVAYVANDNMAESVIAALKTVNLDKKVLVTGQDAAQVAITNILNGEQAMTVYKPYGKEAESAAKIVAAISKGDDVKTIATTNVAETTSNTQIPSLLEEPIAVDLSNVKDTIIKDNFYTKDQVCKGVAAGAGGVC
ncbi:sugar ABC transporter substrate-binding protein [Dictyobacter alpinus]|uniref:Sugar ABC transporter substrate-binding protein n=1 Tax=Dictyobacter alpinus TaxID=2014873 RepID=A0A402AZN4_9CHLR|nr:substrate-binding domain-containing protein [Dictyobacter alpinus]GCE24533.1 sugar ABC transporter substrate-binding protein [Dictyobacter alpinus]